MGVGLRVGTEYACGIMNSVCPNPGLEQYFPPVGRSRIFLSFAGIAKGLHLFLSSCVSAVRHPEEHLGTLYHVLAAEGSEPPIR